MATTRERLAGWLKMRDLSQERAAKLLGCSQSMVSAVLVGSRHPNLELAVAIEDNTKDLESGPIRARDWVHEPIVEASSPTEQGR